MADSEQVQCQFCKGTYKKRGLANHQRSCKQKPQDIKPGEDSELPSGKVSSTEKCDQEQSETIQCEYCGRTYKKRGLATHQRSCKQKPQDSKEQRESSELQSSKVPPVANPKQEQSNTLQCQFCGGTYKKKGLATHQRACKQKHMDHGEDSGIGTSRSVLSETVTDPVQAGTLLGRLCNETQKTELEPHMWDFKQNPGNMASCPFCCWEFAHQDLPTHVQRCKQNRSRLQSDSQTGEVISENQKISPPLHEKLLSTSKSYNHKRGGAAKANGATKDELLLLKKFLITPQGGYASLPQHGVSIVVPEGAITEKSKELFIGISNRKEDRPVLPTGQSRTSPIIVCGPHGTHFKKHVLLSFPHNVPNVDNAVVKLWQSQTDLNQQCKWEEADARTCVNFTPTRCLLSLNHFTKHTTSCSQKRVLAAAFGDYDCDTAKLSLNVHCVDDMPTALKELNEQMAELNMHRLAPDGRFVFHSCVCREDEERDVKVTLLDLGKKWRVTSPGGATGGGTPQIIYFDELQNNLQPYRNYVLKPHGMDPVRDLHCDIDVRQENQDPKSSSAKILVRKSMSQIVKFNTPRSSSSVQFEIGTGTLKSDLHPMRFLSPKERTSLNEAVKTPKIWRIIAADIGLDGTAERKGVDLEPCALVFFAVGESFLEMLKLFRRVERKAHVKMQKSLDIIYNARILEASYEKLKRHTPEIINSVDPKDVYIQLFADGILTFYDKDEIEKACTRSTVNGCSILLNKIFLCPVEKTPIPKLCNALREQNCKRMADLLELSLDDIEPKET
ncbi:uncharacterized protein LOC106152139 [Lingula anatina]|uniref:Netrin receptor UNC5 n=1 Tax=Lingula anatina TaxID=7574 RepID=A0A1S3H509_LINAN|nr:uncharacterized protein LOC106152139 [Lingula anatina]|eukprot:XP_013381088.1 uncharacterized protein LOC106152139 [Lingula anatina]